MKPTKNPERSRGDSLLVQEVCQPEINQVGSRKVNAKALLNLNQKIHKDPF